MALYGRNFILLLEEGVTLPANLQGLCECRYSGEELDMPATMTLFKAFNDFTRLRPTNFSNLPAEPEHWNSAGGGAGARQTCSPYGN
jgi:hypothetical protein